MMIKVNCNKCGKTITVGEELTGGRMECPFCRQEIVIRDVQRPDEPKMVIMEKNAPLPEGYERRLSNGAVVIFGPHALETMAGLKQGMGGDQLMVCSEAAGDLLLPDTLMTWGMIVFDHAIRGKEGVKRSAEELKAWSRELTGGLDFASGAEPEPEISMTMDEQEWRVTLMAQWMPPQSGPWNGVRSGQVRRVALALEAAYERASKQPTSVPAQKRRRVEPAASAPAPVETASTASTPTGTPLFKFFFCPHCAKRFWKNDPVFAGADLVRAMDAATGGGGVMGVFSESVPCPACGKPIDLAGIYQGRFESPRATRGWCLGWIVIIGIILFVLWFLLTAADRPH